ncbi:946_t:CDS:2, partial [Funneliformis mosseae]
IQYPMGKPDGQNATTFPYLNVLQEMQHESIVPDSDLRLKVNAKLSTNNPKNNTFIEYLAAYKTKCKHITQYRSQCIRKT